jgi:uracil phosphoribosyltransferase
MECLLAAPEGVERYKGLHPDVPLWTAGVDEWLNEHAFILCEPGDAVDRACGTR